VQPAVINPAAILAPSYLGSIEAKIFAADVVVLAPFWALGRTWTV
jgi:hypothetical protein